MTALLTQKCNIIERVQSIDANRLPSYAENTVHTNLRCKLDSILVRSTERPDPGSIQSEKRSILYTEYKSDIKEHMLVDLEGVRYNIVSINPVTNMLKNHHLELEIVATVNE